MEDVKSDGFVLGQERKPTEPDSSSAHCVRFARGEGVDKEELSCSVAVYPAVPVAERHYNDLKFNCGDRVVDTVAIGDEGFVTGPPKEAGLFYTIIFRKNNVVITVWGLTDYNELQSCSRIVEAWIY